MNMKDIVIEVEDRLARGQSLETIKQAMLDVSTNLIEQAYFASPMIHGAQDDDLEACDAEDWEDALV